MRPSYRQVQCIAILLVLLVRLVHLVLSNIVLLPCCTGRGLFASPGHQRRRRAAPKPLAGEEVEVIVADSGNEEDVAMFIQTDGFCIQMMDFVLTMMILIQTDRSTTPGAARRRCRSRPGS